jgi:hypothetical protein
MMHSIKLFLPLAVIVAASSNILCQSGDERLVAQAIEKLRVAMVNPDSVVLTDIASEDLEYVHSSGTVRNKRGFIDEFMKRQTHFTSATISNQTIKITGDNAIVRHRLVADAKIEGQPPVIDIIILMVWRKENGKWKLLARQAAKIPEKK